MKPPEALVILSMLCAAPLLSVEAPSPKRESLDSVTFEEIASGTWGVDYEGVICVENPHTITSTADGLTMTLRYAKGVDRNPPLEAVYSILGEGPDYKRMQVVGEARTTDAGVPVVWDLVLLSPDSYCWHRTDWQEGGCTKPATRCR